MRKENMTHVRRGMAAQIEYDRTRSLAESRPVVVHEAVGCWYKPNGDWVMRCGCGHYEDAHVVVTQFDTTQCRKCATKINRQLTGMFRRTWRKENE